MFKKEEEQAESVRQGDIKKEKRDGSKNISEKRQRHFAGRERGTRVEGTKTMRKS